MNTGEPPLYVSKRSVASLGQQYRVYRDRLELQCWILLHTLVIPADRIEKIEVRPSIFGGGKGFTWGVKIDNADLRRHVLLSKTSGFWRRIAFTPDDPEQFVAACRAVMPEQRGLAGGSPPPRR